MVASGYSITLTHGNGPQVGDIIIQNEIARNEVPPMPLDVCVAESQGMVGYMLQQALTNALYRGCCDRIVPCVLTRVVVDVSDEAFRDPNKPIGPYYSEGDASRLSREHGWHFHEDLSRGGWRRVVPSPRPLAIVESPAIGRLVHSGNDLVIAAGGGGIPVTWKEDRWVGVEAVVDKDLASACLAK
jgi:carbamate kinase